MPPDFDTKRNSALHPTMEAVDTSGRRSGILSIINREEVERTDVDRTYTRATTMGPSSVVSPVSMYSKGPPPPYSDWSGPHSTSGLASPPESRRTSDNKTEHPPPIQSTQMPSHRQSLPSIAEALNPKPYAPPVSTSLPPAHAQLAYSQAPTIPRAYPPSDHAPYPTHLATSQPRQPSPPYAIQPQAPPFTRAEPPPPDSYRNHARHPSIVSPHSPTPHNQYPGPRYNPPRYESDHRAAERVPNGYPTQPHTPQSSYTYPPGPNQLSKPHERSYNQAQYPPEDRRGMENGWKGGMEDERSHTTAFKQGLKRQYMVWDFENYLSAINVSSSALQNWSNHYHTITQEQAPRDANGSTDRMPSLESCNDMLQHQDRIRGYLEQMRDMISEQHQHAAMQEQSRDHAGKGPGYYDNESMYGDELKNQGYVGQENKKRRGRAAPPGRCHSCNRAETPEWRRGPDGARTLCNACGLHYAKLTRKNTMKQSQGSAGSSLRPKSMDGDIPRPL